jgi:predicted nucleic acid-binding protein
MTFADLQSGESIFLDANTLVYYFAPFPVLGPYCSKLIERVVNGDVSAFTSTHILSEIAHRLMVIEASQRFGWKSKIVNHLKRQPAELQKLITFREAIEKVPQLGIQLITIPTGLVATATLASVQYGLLSNDALIAAVMQANNLTNIASNDTDFDRVPWITRYAPV